MTSKTTIYLAAIGAAMLLLGRRASAEEDRGRDGRPTTGPGGIGDPDRERSAESDAVVESYPDKPIDLANPAKPGGSDVLYEGEVARLQTVLNIIRLRWMEATDHELFAPPLAQDGVWKPAVSLAVAAVEPVYEFFVGRKPETFRDFSAFMMDIDEVDADLLLDYYYGPERGIYG